MEVAHRSARLALCLSTGDVADHALVPAQAVDWVERALRVLPMVVHRVRRDAGGNRVDALLSTSPDRPGRAAAARSSSREFGLVERMRAARSPAGAMLRLQVWKPRAPPQRRGCAILLPRELAAAKALSFHACSVLERQGLIIAARSSHVKIRRSAAFAEIDLFMSGFDRARFALPWASPVISKLARPN